VSYTCNCCSNAVDCYCPCFAQAEVVGMYFSNMHQHQQQQQQQQQQQPGQQPQQQDPPQLCLKCYRMYAANVGLVKAEQIYTRVAPHAPCLGGSTWSESGSEFISTRDSFSSCEEEEDDEDELSSPSGAGQLAGSSSRHSPAVPRLPPNKGQLTAQQQRQLAWLSAAVNRGVASGPAPVQQQQQQLLPPPQQPLQAGQQQQQQQPVTAGQQMPVPAPGMFVFGSKGASSSSAAAAPGASSSAGTPAAGLAGSRLPAGQAPAAAAAAGVGRKAAAAGADALSFELIAELEAVHAARKVFLQGQPAAAAAAAAPFLQQVAAFSQQQQQQQQAAGVADSSSTGLPALAPLGTARQPDGAAAGDASSSAAGSVSGADMGTPTASGRTWRDWLLPKKLLQWSEGEEGQEEAADGQQDDVFGQMARHSSEPDQRESAAASASVLRRHSDGTAGVVSRRGGASSSSSRQQAQQRQVGEGAAGDVVGRGPSSAPCSPRTPAAKDSTRQVQGPEGAADAAAVGCAALELDSTAEQDLSRVPKQRLAAGGPVEAAAAGTSGLSSSAAAQEQQLVPVKAGLVQQGQLGTAAGISSGPGMQQVDASIAAAGGDVLVDEIIRCMAQVYAADKDVADMTLGCLVDFVRRKLLGPGSNSSSGHSTNSLIAAAPAGPGLPAGGSTGDADSAYFSSGSSSKESSPASSGPAAAGQAAGASSSALALPAAAALLPPGELQLVQQFLASPEAAYLSPEMMHATLCCLPASDLQMALAYVVRQHEDTMTQPGQSDSEADTASQSVLPEDDAGCMPLFQLHHLDELSFEQLVEHIWPGELEEGAIVTAASSAAASSGKGAAGGAAGAGKGGKAAQQLRSKQLGKADRGDSAAATAAAAAAAAKQQMKEQPKLLPASWWVEHLQQSGKAADPPAAAAADQRVLRWVYGNIVSSQAEEFAAGQAALSCNLDRQTALLELYEGMANAWRRMQRVADKRRVLEQLRQNIKVRLQLGSVKGLWLVHVAKMACFTASTALTPLKGMPCTRAASLLSLYSSWLPSAPLHRVFSHALAAV
jgi:hypothetical protein